MRAKKRGEVSPKRNEVGATRPKPFATAGGIQQRTTGRVDPPELPGSRAPGSRPPGSPKGAWYVVTEAMRDELARLEATLAERKETKARLQEQIDAIREAPGE